MGVNIQKLYSSLLNAMGEAGSMTKEEIQAKLGMTKSGENSATPTLDQYSRNLNEMAKQGITWEERFLNRDGSPVSLKRNYIEMDKAFREYSDTQGEES